MGWIWDFLTNLDNLRPVIQKAFNCIDRDGSGEISSNDLLSCITSINQYYDTGIHPTEEELKFAIVFADEDRSGKISFEEFMNLLKKLSYYEFPDKK